MKRFVSARVAALVFLLTGAAASAGYKYYHDRDPVSLLRRARESFEAGRPAEAVRLKEELERRGCDGPVALLRGEAWLHKGKALEGPAPPSAAQVQRAGQFVSAAAGLDRVPAGLRAAAWLSATLFQGAADPPSPAARAYRSALAEFTSVRDDGPVGLDATLRAAECLARLGERGLAAEGFLAVVRRRPDHLEAHRWLAAVYMDLNSPPEAIRHLHAWARLDPADGRPLRWVGFFCKDFGRPAEAVAAYREALERRLDPSLRAAVARELALTLIESQSAYAEALDALDQVPGPFRLEPDTLALRARVCWGLGRGDEATRLLDRALAGNPDLPAALVLRAAIFLTEDRRDQALPLLEHAAALAPDDLACRKQLMEAYRRGGDLSRAELHRRLLAETRQIKEELTELQRLALGKPWDDDVRYRIALLCLKIRRLPEARMWLRAAAACNPANGPARLLLAQLGP